MATFTVDYDADFDVLYIKEPSRSIEYTDEVNDGIFASFSENDEIVGFIVMDFIGRETLPLQVYSERFAEIPLSFIKDLVPEKCTFTLNIAEHQFEPISDGRPISTYNMESAILPSTTLVFEGYSSHGDYISSPDVNWDVDIQVRTDVRRRKSEDQTEAA